MQETGRMGDKYKIRYLYVIVHDNEDDFLENNPLVSAAFCIFEENSHQIRAEQFFPQIEALTILYGRDTINKTIEYELSDFEDVLALDIQGYENVGSSSDNDVALHSNALLHLYNLRYLNIEHVFLFPNPNTTSDDKPTIEKYYSTFEQLEQRRSELEQRRFKVNLQLNTETSSLRPYDEYNRSPERTEELRFNISFVPSDDLKIVPYEQFKKQQNLISTFSHLSNLQFLRLYRCHLETITWDMFKDLGSLQMLSLEGNDLVEIPKLAFFSMPSLKTLVLANNQLQHLDWESLAGLFELEYLDLSGNNLRYLSEMTFAPLPTLKYLDLRGNPVETIYSNTFEVMNATESLLIGSRQPLGLHANAFKGLDSVQRLVIHGLQVESLNIDLLRGMPKLKYLEINGQLDNIEFDAFTDSLELEVLLLRNCSLKYVSVDAFFALFDLKVLDLSWNQLETLAPGIFNQLDSLNELILSHNRFVELPHVLDGLQHVKMVRLEHNPWNCSCDMANWRSLKWNKVKEHREVDVPCTYKYDKTPCQTRIENYYVLSASVLPRCSMPVEFRGYSVPHVLNKKLKCHEKRKKFDEKMIKLAHAEFSPIGGPKTKGRHHKVRPKHKVTAEPMNENFASDENVDNNLHDLGLLMGTLMTHRQISCLDKSISLRCPNGTNVIIKVARYVTLPPAVFVSIKNFNICEAIAAGAINNSLVIGGAFSEATATALVPNVEKCQWPESLQYSLLQTAVEACRSKQQCQFQVSPSKSGFEACSRKGTYVQVEYNCRPSSFSSKVGCEHEKVNFECEPYTRLAIFSASYGRTQYQSVQCPQPQGVAEETCLLSYATEIVIDHCHGKRNCTLVADSKTFTNPCREKSRVYLKVVYACVPRKVLLEKYEEQPFSDENPIFEEVGDPHDVLDNPKSLAPFPDLTNHVNYLNQSNGNDATLLHHLKSNTIHNSTFGESREKLYLYLIGGASGVFISLTVFVIARLIWKKRRSRSDDKLRDTNLADKTLSHSFNDEICEVDADVTLAQIMPAVTIIPSHHHISSPSEVVRYGKDDITPRSLYQDDNSQFYYG